MAKHIDDLGKKALAQKVIDDRDRIIKFIVGQKWTEKDMTRNWFTNE